MRAAITLDTARVALDRLGLFEDYVRVVLGAVSVLGGGVLLTPRALGPRHYSINPWASQALRGAGMGAS